MAFYSRPVVDTRNVGTAARAGFPQNARLQTNVGSGWDIGQPHDRPTDREGPVVSLLCGQGDGGIRIYNDPFPKDGPPSVEGFVLRDLDDIASLEIPDDLARHPALQEPLKRLRMLKREAGGKYLICAYLSSSTTLLALLMGMLI